MSSSNQQKEGHGHSHLGLVGRNSKERSIEMGKVVVQVMPSFVVNLIITGQLHDL